MNRPPHNRKLPADDTLATMFERLMSNHRIAKTYGVSKQAVWQARNRLGYPQNKPFVREVENRGTA